MRSSFIERLSDAVDWVGMRLSDGLIVDRIWIGVLLDKEFSLLERTRDALSLIETHDPVRYKRVQRDIEKIWITIDPHAIGKYIHRRRLIVLDARYIREAEPEIVASLIVHEAAHARLARFGYEEPIRARIERCCIKREAAFARMYSGGEQVVSWALERHRKSDDFWSDRLREQRRRERESATARELGIPEWLLHFAHRGRG